MVMTTAHPAIDPDRNVMWTVNTHWGALHVCRWDGRGPVESWPIDGGLIPQSVHTITRVEVFDAADVGRGPVATATAGGRRVPFVLHSAWMPSVSTPGQPLANRFSDELDRVDELPDDLARAAREVAHDLDHAVPMA